MVHQEDFDIIENVLPKDDAVVMSCWQTVKEELTQQPTNSAMEEIATLINLLYEHTRSFPINDKVRLWSNEMLQLLQ